MRREGEFLASAAAASFNKKGWRLRASSWATGNGASKEEEEEEGAVVVAS